MTTTTVQGAAIESSAGHHDRRWFALAVLAVAQLMVVLDASIVTIALPHAQSALHITDANRQWVQTAYALSFGGLLLLGGRIADYTGRKRAFLIGLGGFAAASALGGVAPNGGSLIAARALQGAMAAILAPAALSLITTTFTDAKERAKAFGVYGAISGGGAAIGLVAGGLLTEYTTWRWCLLVNVPIALLTAFLAIPLISESKHHGPRHYDLPGAVTATGGLASLVYGFSRASTDGWSDSVTVTCLALAVVLLASFVAIEQRVDNPMLPMRVVLDFNRGGSYLGMLLAGTALFGTFLFLTFYFQATLHYSPLKAGLLFLPFSAGVITSATAATTLLPRFGPRRLAPLGFLSGAIGLVWLTTIPVHASFTAHVLGPELLISMGMGQVFVSLSSTALVGVDPTDSGVASALVNAAQQIGGAIGTALLSTIATSATTSYLRSHHSAPTAGVHGYTVAFAASAGLMALAAVTTAVLVRARTSDLPAGEGAVLA